MIDSVVLNINIDACLECPVCMDLLSVPVYQCTNGHSICPQCTRSDKISLKICPICRCSLTGDLRNYSLERILENITMKCKFGGCTDSVKLSERIEHENLCRFNPYIECTLPDCLWKGLDLCAHLKQTHAIKEFNMDNCGTRGWNSKTWKEADWGFSIWNFNGKQVLNQSISNKNFFFLWVYNIQEEPLRLKLTIGNESQRTSYTLVTTSVKNYKKHKSMPLHMNIVEIEKFFLEPAEGLDEGYKRLTIEVRVLNFKGENRKCV